MPQLLPLFLNLTGRRVLLVGGGPVAAAKFTQLLAVGADVHLVAPEVCGEIERQVEGANASIDRRGFEPADLDGVWLVVAAATPEVNRLVAAAAEPRRLFVNAVDDPENASAFLSGVVRRDGVTLAISTAGAAPGLTALLRQALDHLLPRDLAAWVDEARVQRAAWRRDGVPMDQRRPLLLQALIELYKTTTEHTEGTEASGSPGKTTEHTEGTETNRSPGKITEHTESTEANRSPGKITEHTESTEASRSPGKTTEHTEGTETNRSPGKTTDHTEGTETSHPPDRATIETSEPNGNSRPGAGDSVSSVSSVGGSVTAGCVALVGAGPGDPGLLTRRAVARLRAADLVLYDALIDRQVLKLARQAQRFFVGKRAGRRAMSQQTINALMIRAARRGKRVVRLKGGDPFVFGRGGEEALALRAAGISVEIVPGVTSAVAAPALAGIPVTHRGVSSAFLVVGGHDLEAFASAIDTVAPNDLTLVVLMGVGRREALARRLIERGWHQATPAAIVMDASRPTQTVWRGTLENLASRRVDIEQDGPGTIVIGQVVRVASEVGEFGHLVISSSGH